MKKANRELLLVYDARHLPACWTQEISSLENILQQVETTFCNAQVSEVFDVARQKALRNTYQVAQLITEGKTEQPFVFLNNRN